MFLSLRTSVRKLWSGFPNPEKTSIVAQTSRADVHEKTLVSVVEKTFLDPWVQDFDPAPPPPLQKILPAAFFVSGINFVGITRKSLTWLPEIISGELIPWDYRKVWPGLSVV